MLPMHKVLILGAGNIGSMIACLLAHSNSYQIYLADKDKIVLPIREQLSHLELFQIDINHAQSLADFIQRHKIETVVSCLPYYKNNIVIAMAKQQQLNYFDLTEDTATAKLVQQSAEGSHKIFMPQCGLAPGFVNIVANYLMQQFDTLDSVELRAGNLPININNALHYALSWSTDGLINEYGNLCEAVVEGQRVKLPALEDLESIEIDGKNYEAFNTSGGVGSLVDSYHGKLKNLNYKTIRYPGHCEKMRFLMKDLRLNEDRETLKNMLERVLPHTIQDVALIYVSATGKKKNQLLTQTYVNSIYPWHFLGYTWTAIQTATASGLCGVLDLLLNSDHHYGLILQEQINFSEFIQNRFGKIFAKSDI